MVDYKGFLDDCTTGERISWAGTLQVQEKFSIKKGDLVKVYDDNNVCYNCIVTDVIYHSDGSQTIEIDRKLKGG